MYNTFFQASPPSVTGMDITIWRMQVTWHGRPVFD